MFLRPDIFRVYLQPRKYTSILSRVDIPSALMTRVLPVRGLNNLQRLGMGINRRWVEMEGSLKNRECTDYRRRRGIDNSIRKSFSNSLEIIECYSSQFSKTQQLWPA